MINLEYIRPTSSLVNRYGGRLWSVLLLVTALAGSTTTEAASRVALVLAAEQYASFSRSPLGVNTVKVVADSLVKQGFEVIVSENPSNAGARAALREFATKAAGAETALVVMSGHGAATAGLTYFLPVNIEIAQETDLFSRALAIPSFVQAVSKAKTGAVFFMMSVPNLASTMQAISFRPAYNGPLEKNTLLAFSTSDKVPVSRIDAVSKQALADLTEVAKEPQLKLAALVAATTGGGIGRVFGEVGDVSLSPPKVASTINNPEKPARVEERPPPVAPVPSTSVGKQDDVAALQLVEAMMGYAQRRAIQARLQELGHYSGGLDSIFGDLTREAIRSYQKKIGAEPTGYMSPGQLQTLLKK